MGATTAALPVGFELACETGGWWSVNVLGGVLSRMEVLDTFGLYHKF